MRKRAWEQGQPEYTNGSVRIGNGRAGNGRRWHDSSEYYFPEPQPRSRYCLIAREYSEWTDVLTWNTGTGMENEEILPVFSGEDEAEMFLWLAGFESGWQAWQRSPGELISALCGPCADVDAVALDPSPEMVSEANMLGLVSLSRERFVKHILRSVSRERSAQSGVSRSGREVPHGAS